MGNPYISNMKCKKRTQISVGIGPHERKRLLERHRVDVKLILKGTLITRIIMRIRLCCFMID
jgi:hypothetical protein